MQVEASDCASGEEALEGRATEAVLEFLGDTLVGSWVSAGGRARRGIEAVPEREMVSEGEEGGPGPP